MKVVRLGHNFVKALLASLNIQRITFSWNLSLINYLLSRMLFQILIKRKGKKKNIDNRWLFDISSFFLVK